MPLAIPDEAAKMPWRCCGVKGLWGTVRRSLFCLDFGPAHLASILPSNNIQLRFEDRSRCISRYIGYSHLIFRRSCFIEQTSILVQTSVVADSQQENDFRSTWYLDVRGGNGHLLSPASSSLFPWARGPLFITRPGMLSI